MPSLPRPRAVQRVIQSPLALLFIGVYVGVGLLWWRVPELRPGLDASAGHLFAMLPAALCGLALRMGHDMVNGRILYWRRREPTEAYILSAMSFGSALYIVQRGVNELSGRIPDGLGLAAGLGLILLPLVAMGLVALTGIVAYVEGNDHNGRGAHRPE